MNRNTYMALFRRLERTATRYAECIKITRTDGTIFRFTAHDRDLIVTENDVKVTYTPANAFKLTALEMQSGLAVSNMEIDAIVDSASITESDLEAGKFDGAEVRLYIAYWSNLTVAMLPLRVSWIGAIRTQGESFKGDMRGIAQRLAQIFLQSVSLECRYTFGDAKCGLDLTSMTTAYTVASVIGEDEFLINTSAAGQIYQWGLAKFTSGANAGVSMEIVHHFTDKIKLFLPLSYPIQVGDAVTLVQGCAKTYDACTAYNNVVRFGGEPFLANSDVLQRYPNAH